MANLSVSLQEYLNHSKSGKDNNKSEETNGNNNKSLYSWFSSKNPEKNVDETVNGWFSDAQKDPLLPNLSKKQRVLGFIACITLGICCFALAGLYLPFLFLKARKFAILYTMGSFFTISSFSLLWGPVNHFKHICSANRLPFTTLYFGSMFATLYFGLWTRSIVLTVFAAVTQVLALVWYLISYIPGGQTGLKFFTKVFSSTVSKTVQKTLPV